MLWGQETHNVFSTICDSLISTLFLHLQTQNLVHSNSLTTFLAFQALNVTYKVTGPEPGSLVRNSYSRTRIS